MRKGKRTGKRHTSKRHTSKKNKRRIKKHTRRMKGGACPRLDPTQTNDKMYIQQHKLCQFSHITGRTAS